jgi:hypothetical protein
LDFWFENKPSGNPGYNASVVNFYNATGSLARFENKNIIFYFLERSSLLQRWRCSCKFKYHKDWLKHCVDTSKTKITVQVNRPLKIEKSLSGLLNRQPESAERWD